MKVITHLFPKHRVVAISFIQTSSLSKRQLRVQIMVIKVFIPLQERSSSLTHIAVSQSGAIRKSSANLFYSPFLQGPLPSLPYRERYQVVYLFMVILEKGGKCPLDPLTICVSLPLSLPNHSTSSHTECFSNCK